jgi:hypothetical protein
MAAEGELLGFENHAHAPVTDLAKDAIVTQSLEPPTIEHGPHRRTSAALTELGLLHEEDGGEDLADLVGPRGVFLDVLLDRRRFPAAESIEELLG